MKNLVVVHGTWGRADAWHGPHGLIRKLARDRDIRILDFLWSGVLAGVPTKLPGDPDQEANGADDGKLLPWYDAGEKLALWIDHLQQRRDEPLHVLSHSHGLQVVTFAAVQGIHFDTAVSVSGPIRRDMQRARRQAKSRIAHWVQFVDPSGTDKTIVEGEMFDGDLGAEYHLPEGQTILTYMTGHSGALTDPKWIGMMLDTL